MIFGYFAMYTSYIMDIIIMSQSRSGDASIKEFLKYANNIYVNKDIHKLDDTYEQVFKDLSSLYDKLSNISDELDKTDDGQELYAKIIVNNATIPKTGKNSHIFLNRMTFETFFTFFPKHIESKINLLKKGLDMENNKSTNYDNYVNTLLTFFDDIKKVLPKNNNYVTVKREHKLQNIELYYDKNSKNFYHNLNGELLLVDPFIFIENIKKN